MSKTVTISGFVYEVDWGGGEKQYRLMSADTASDKWYSLIGPASFEYTTPDDFDPRGQKVAALQEVQRKLKAEFAKKMIEIEDDLSKLLAIT